MKTSHPAPLQEFEDEVFPRNIQLYKCVPSPAIPRITHDFVDITYKKYNSYEEIFEEVHIALQRSIQEDVL